MPFLSNLARRAKVRHFLNRIPKEARVLEVGCGAGWVGDYLRRHAWHQYVGIDLHPPADIVGDVREWRALGLAPASFDVIIAFEVVEHVDCFAACHELLRPGGRMMITTPLPCADRILRLLEWLGLNQRRTSPHDHLVYLKKVPSFDRKEVRIVGLMSQWAIFTKADQGGPVARSPCAHELPRAHGKDT